MAVVDMKLNLGFLLLLVNYKQQQKLMASGFCLRVLLLSLMTYGQLALGNIYRHGSKIIRPYTEQAEASPWTYNPVSSTYDISVHPRGSKATSTFPDGPKTSVSRQGPSHFFSGQVDSYSPSGSVSSYKPASVQWRPKQTPQQSQSSFFQVRPGAWDPSQGERKGSNVVSSGAIVMHAETPRQQLSSSSGEKQGKAYMWDDGANVQPPWMKYPAKLPQNHPAFSAPPVLQSKAGMWDSVLASSAKSPGLSLPAKSPQNPVLPAPPVLQSKAGMWDSVLASSAKSPGLSLPAKSPQNPVLPVLQSKAGMWDSVLASSAKSPGLSLPAKSPQNPVLPVLQSKAGMWDSVLASSAKSPGLSLPAKSPQNPVLPAPPVLQSKAGMWDSVFASSAKSPGSYPPVDLPQNPEPPVQQSKSTMWKSVSSSNLQSPKSHLQAKLPPNLPAFSAPAVLQSKAGMWDSVLAASAKSLDVSPRSSRPEAFGYYPLRQQQPRLMGKTLQQPASSISQRKGGLGDKAQVKSAPRSSKPVPVSSLFRSGGLQQQLASAHINHQP
ncbi:uncharacterized protein LOC108246355 isoform X1 [Kryptolebias marmoratus]|uniref:uncharacterized protein LOC108246355 isoform X1 n=1 Tax=Kryptolebias marmoratus TaxID=37003 RepID=UPI0018ACABB3|nr:uncharacterized protein LOC108246355 isoform X1 [Kryptolebias marmoratus]